MKKIIKTIAIDPEVFEKANKRAIEMHGTDNAFSWYVSKVIKKDLEK